MPAQDLSRLQIDRDTTSFAGRRRPRSLKWPIGIAIVVALAGFGSFRWATTPATVDVATVTSAFPSQGFTVLNATGRVVAWRKAAVSTKATGRLEWLGVQEGSRVKAGEVIARLESLDVGATRDSALAAVTAAKANLEQGEAELRDAGLRRITDTFLPEDESVRIMEPHLLKMWQQAQAKGERYFPHEYFWRLFSGKLISPDAGANENDCWTYAAWQKKVPIVIPGFEDSTMGNIFSSYTYGGPHRKEGGVVLDGAIMKNGLEYFHLLYDWYMEISKDAPVAFLQLGGGIAADFPICVVPSLKHDLGHHGVRDWAGFVEIGSSPMSYGSYSGAGGKEKITWDKLSPESYFQIIQSDVTVAFPWIAAVLLGL